MRRSNPALGLSKLRRAEAARLYPPPPKGLSCVPASAFCVSFRSQSKDLERRPARGCVLKRMQGISAFPHRRSRAQALSVCGRWMRLPTCGIAPLREWRACVCLCIAAAFFALGFCAAYEEQRFCAADFLRTMRRRSERGLSAAGASRRRHGVHRPFFRRRAKLDRPPLFERANRRAVWYPSQTPWPHIPRRAAAEGAERAAAEARGNVSSAADSSLLRSASKAARASRPPPRAASQRGRSAERRLSIWKILQLHGFS